MAASQSLAIASSENALTNADERLEITLIVDCVNLRLRWEAGSKSIESALLHNRQDLVTFASWETACCRRDKSRVGSVN
jgi:hypothetical protein